MTNEELFNGLTELAKQELGDQVGGAINSVAFSVLFTAQVGEEKTGGIVGGAIRVDPQGEAVETSQDLVAGGTIPSLVSYILMKQSAGILDRCLGAAILLKRDAAEEQQ